MTPWSMKAFIPVVVLAALAGGCSRHPGGASDTAGDPAADAVVDVRAAAVEMRTFENTIAAPGQWRSSGELVVAAAFAGVLESVKARVGDHVSRGQTVAIVVTRESWAALRGAELMRDAAHDANARTEARQALELAKRDVVRVPLAAPQAGVVVRRSLEPGAQVAESAEILALVPAGEVVFEAHVPATNGPRLRVGQRATVNEQDGTMRTAVVQRVLPMANDADQSVLVWLAPDHATTPQLDRYGTARIVIGARHTAPAVPDSAVVEDDLTGNRQVAVVGTGGRMTWTPVELGTAEAGWHEVVHPALAAGTKVVTSGQRGLPDSTRVKWAP